MRLRFIEETPGGIEFLYELLKERTPEQSISHKEMPSFEEHREFVLSKPYLCWYIIYAKEAGNVGAIYLSENREVGISIHSRFRRKGYARTGLLMLMAMHPGKFLANINPQNEWSKKFFGTFGFRHIQNTYVL